MSRPFRRRWLAVAGILVVAVAALVLGLFPQEPLRRRVERELQSAFGPDARIGGLRVVPWRLRAEARDIAIAGEAYRLEVARLELALEPSLLIGGPLSISWLALESPRLRLRPLAATGPSAPPWRLPVVRSLRLHDGALDYEDPAALTLRLSGLAARGSLGVGSLEIEASGGAIEGRGVIPIRSLRAKLGLSPRLDLQLHSFAASAGGSRLTASGLLGRIGALAPDLRAEARLDLADAAALGIPRPLTGALEVEARLRGGGRDLRLEAQVRSADLGLDGWPLREVRGRIEHTAAGAGRTSVSLGAELLGGRLEAEGQRDGAVSRGTLRVEKVDLEALRRAAGLGGPFLAGAVSGHVDAEGDISAAVQLRGRIEAERLLPELDLRATADASGRLDLRGAGLDLAWTATFEGRGVPGAALGPFRVLAEGTTQGPFPPTIEGSIDGGLRLLTQAGPADALLEGSFRAQGDSGEAELGAHLLDGTITASARARGSRVESLTIGGESLSLAAGSPTASGRARFRIDAYGPADRLSLAGQADIDALEWQGATLGPVAATLEGQGRLHWTLAAPALGVTGRGELAGDGERLSGTLRLTATPLAPFAPLVAQDVTGALSGSIELDVPLGAPGETQARLRLESGEAARGPWSARLARPVTLVVHGSRIEVTDLGLQGHAGELEASGRLGMAATDPVELRLAGALELAGLPWPAGWAVGGQTTADVTLSGTRAAPEARGHILIRQLTAEGPSFPALVLDAAALDLTGRDARLPEASAEIAGGRIAFSAEMPLAFLAPGSSGTTGHGSAHGRLTWSGVEARRLIERLRPGGATLDASLAGRIDIEAPALSLRALRGRLELPSTAMAAQDVSATLEPLSVQLREGRLETQGVTLETPGGRFTASGAVDVLERRLELQGRGTLALRALSPLLGAASLAGTAEIDVTLAGTFESPRPAGQLRVRDGAVRLRDIPQALTDLAATVVFENETLRLEDTSAVVGGGPLTLAGSSALADGALSDVRLTLSGRDIALRYPPGLKSRVDTDLTLTGRTGSLLLSGSVRANRGLYDLDLAFTESFRAVAARASESSLLRSVGLEIRIETPSPVRVKNNIADLQASSSLTLRGDLQEPAPFGRLDLLSGGKVFLQGRGFAIESGRLEYAGSWDPAVNVVARTQLRATDEVDYAIGVEAVGTLERPALRFSSSPTLSEPEIVSLIATGRTRDEALRSSGWVVGEQTAVLLAGSLTHGVSETLRGLGLDEVTIQPELLAREADPGARFTFGKQLGPAVRLIYSLSLNNPEDRFVQVEARPGLAATGTFQRRDDGTLRYGLGQRLELGGTRRRGEGAAEERTRLRELRFEADTAFSEAELREGLALRQGDRVSAWQLQEKAERLRERLQELGHLEAEVGARLDGDAAVFRIHAGARYSWRSEGMQAAPDLSREIRKALFEEEALALGRERLLAVLRARGHLRAEVEARAVGDERERSLVFIARPGSSYARADVRFPGARALSESRLRAAAGGPAAWLVAPDDARRRAREAYADRHYLAAEIGAPQVAEQGDRLVIRVPVLEGPPAQVVAIVFEEASVPAAELAAIAGIRLGAAYDPAVAAQAAQRVRDHYLGLGHAGARVVASARREGTDVVAVFRVTEGPRVTLGSIEVVGATRTDESLIRRQIDLEPGDPVDPRKLAASERRLLDLGAFSRATILASPDNPTTLRVEVEERARLRAGYDVRYDDEDKATVQVDGELAGLLGRGLAVGGRMRAGRDVREARGSLHIPALGAGDLVGSVFQREEDFSAVDPFTLEPIEATRVERGFQLQQTLKLPERWNLLYGYRFKRSSVRPTLPDPFDVAALEASLVRDSRDSPLDARRGRFLSANVEYSPSFVGSDFTFVKGLAQAFVTRSLRAWLVWAQGYRLGLAKGFGGQRLVSSERFQAGGPNTVRGYPSESLGPRDVFGEPAGGQALFVLNQELRYRHRSGLGAAVFYDAGNVFETAGEFGFDLRHALGFGVRWASPVGLLRLDLGFPLAREPDEKSYQLSFGLGQAY